MTTEHKVETITITKLHSLYDHYAPVVLADYLKAHPKKARTPARFDLLSTLPPIEDYIERRAKTFSINIVSAIDQARDIVEGLKDEICEWRDNMESNNLGSTPKYEEVEECASALESVEVSENPDGLPPLSFVDLPSANTSRGHRSAHAVNLLSTAADLIRTFYQEADGRVLEKDSGDNGEETLHPNRDEHETFADDLDSVASELEDISFPGMF